jgi:small-conductance mechanosensitive channel
MGISVEAMQAALDESISALLTAAALFIPRLLNALLILAVGWLLGRITAALVNRLLIRFNFNHLVGRSGLEMGLTQAGIKAEPAYIFSRLIFWLLFLSFILAAVDALGLSTAAEAIRQLLSYIPNLIGAILIIIGGGILARFLGQTTQALAAGAGLEFYRPLGSAVRYFLLILTFIIAVGQLGFDVTFLGDGLINLLMVIVAALGLAFAFGGRDVVRNILAGFYVKEIYQLGQRVQIQTYEGTLEAIGTLKTTIATTSGLVTLPNSLLINEVVTNRDLKE